LGERGNNSKRQPKKTTARSLPPLAAVLARLLRSIKEFDLAAVLLKLLDEEYRMHTVASEAIRRRNLDTAEDGSCHNVSQNGLVPERGTLVAIRPRRAVRPIASVPLWQVTKQVDEIIGSEDRLTLAVNLVLR
jgi:hypothetical protein